MNKSRWLPGRRPGIQTIAALAMAGCAAASLLVAGAGAAAGSAGAPARSMVVTAGHAALIPGRLRLREARTAVRPGLGGRPAAQARNAFAVPGGPAVLAINHRTKTLYVMTFGQTIALVSTTHCNRRDRSGCRVVANVPGQAGFQFVIVDPATDTLYALYGGTDGSGHSVQVINGATCNAGNTSNCHLVATATVGKFPLGESLDPTTHTLYVTNNYDNTVSMINAARCNAMRTDGCAQRFPVIGVGKGPNVTALDQATHTLYVPNNGPGGSGGNTGSGGKTVSMINTATCNATRQSGCTSPAPTATVGTTPFGVTVADGTVYAWNVDDGTASMINAATCNAVRHASCHKAKPTVTTGAGDGPGGSNPRTHTVYVVNNGDDTVSVLDSANCNARDQAGCPAVAPTFVTSELPGLVLPDPATGTVYVANILGNTVSVLNGAACDATHHAGCLNPAPSVPDQEFVIAADPATGTLYGGGFQKQIDVINAATCRSGDLSGCAPVAEIPTPHFGPNVGAIDDATHTLYATDFAPAGTVMVINTAACNAQHTSGCAAAPAFIKVGAFPNVPVLNPATHTLYVSYGAGFKSNKVAVVNAAICNAADIAGCGQTPAVIKVKPGAGFLAVSTKTDTVYAPNDGIPFEGIAGHTVEVINGATCNGTNHTGCGHLAATANVGAFPMGAVVNDHTHTLYVANNFNGDAPGTMSMINTATCNGTHTAGCHGHFPAVATRRGPFAVALDARTGLVYMTAFNGAAVTILNGARCNATVTTGCGTAREQPVGSQPLNLAIDPDSHSVYVTNIFHGGSVSLFRTARP
jgi:DNA-binding beta-propeller fold protein YncE